MLLVTQQIGLRCLLSAKLPLAVKCRYSGDPERWSVQGACRKAETFQGEADVTCAGSARSRRFLLRKIMPFVRVQGLLLKHVLKTLGDIFYGFPLISIQ